MHFEVNVLQMVRKNIFTDTQTTNKVSLMFLDVNVVTES